MKCQYKPVTSICVAPPPENHLRHDKIGHHTHKSYADDQVDGVQPRHEKVKHEKQLHLSRVQSLLLDRARSASGTWKFNPGISFSWYSSVYSTALIPRKAVPSAIVSTSHMSSGRWRPQLGRPNGQRHRQAAAQEHHGIEAAEHDIQLSAGQGELLVGGHLR